MSEPTSPPHEPTHEARTRPGALPLYRVAYEESKRALDDQIAEIDGVRGRVAQFLAFVGTATAFLIGTGLRSPDRDAVFYGLAVLGSTLTFLTLALAVMIMLGMLFMDGRAVHWKVGLRLSAKDLVRWIEPHIHAPDEVDFVRAVTIANGELAEANDEGLVRLRLLYVGFLSSGIAQLTIWAALVWAKG